MSALTPLTTDSTAASVTTLITEKLTFEERRVLKLLGNIPMTKCQCPSAADRANAITKEDIQKSAKSYERAKRLSQVGHQLEAAPPSERDAIIDSIINEFDAATQARIRALATRGERLEAIRVEIKKDNETSIAKTEAMQPHFWCR